MAALCSVFIGVILLNCVSNIAGLPEQGVRNLRLFTVCSCQCRMNDSCATSVLFSIVLLCYVAACLVQLRVILQFTVINS